MLKLVEINLKYCFMFVGQNYLRGRVFASPTVDEKQKNSEALALVNNSIIMICIKIAVTVNQPCQKYCDFKLEEAMPN